MKYNEYYKAREILIDFLKKDLVGPLASDEVISDTYPLQYYSSGILYPQRQVFGQEEQDRDSEAEEYDQSVSLCNEVMPSSLAISFTVSNNTKSLIATINYAWYISEDKGELHQARDEHKHLWTRNSFSKEVPFSIEESNSITLSPGLELYWYLQGKFDDGSKSLTVALVNTNKSTDDQVELNKKSFFQVSLRVSAPDNLGVFIERQSRVELKKDKELINLDMLYRNKKVFASGHGCSVGWQKAGNDVATSVFSEFLPEYNLLQLKPAIHTDENIYGMQYLSNIKQEDIATSLEMLTSAYSKWINKLESRVPTLPTKYLTAAYHNISNCKEALNRIREGVKLLSTSKDVFRAFSLTNEAMLTQRVKYLQARGHKVIAENERWYPFQLAFIIQQLPSIADPNNEYRDIVDLLWFPTGGGKTEAYSGLAAFTIFLRRIRASRNHRSGAGVTILMRYTLRLLTLQQFERACSLICACETIRSDNSKELGSEEISIGLWVGGGMTPNKREEARKSLDKIKATGYKHLNEEANPCQVLLCPWCGANIKPVDYRISDNGRIIYCPNNACVFHNSGLPIYLIDEDIYEHRPSLVISTIDKFARMTWVPEISSLFGLDGKGHLPPELIIQDELHLISGPLGTINGLYEIAVDKFCTRNSIKAKIVASTATIRNAPNQVLNLYGRRLRLFPPQGLDLDDSFFAEESCVDERPARLFLGLMAPGKSVITILVRVYAGLLFGTRYLRDMGYTDEVIDSFWTITGYFNSLRELGGAEVRVRDDVQDRYKYLVGTKFADLRPPFTGEESYTIINELTSRKPSSEIAETLKQLSQRYPSPNAFDFIQASNMISVGLDISRLGLMVVEGQPKSTAEYIQATSRVGRQTPGLVVTLYNPAKSRDRSHYEQFHAYHSSMYKHVEATSVTPFSDRARDRCLHSVLISLARHLVPALRDNDAAKNLRSKVGEVEALANEIVDYVKKVDPREATATRHQLKEIIEYWLRLGEGPLVYQKKGQGNNIPLLVTFQSTAEGIRTLNSMRNVDAECNVSLEG